jgi:ribonucleoside-diphosphate reductase alpha chain
VAKTAKAEAQAAAPAPQAVAEHRPVRKRMPKNRTGRTTSFMVADAKGYMTANSYPDDGVGEVFLKMAKQGSTLAGMMDAFSIAISVGLQYGVPLETYVSKFVNQRFEPAGLTDDPDVRIAQSILDYIFRRLAIDYLPFDVREAHGIFSAGERARQLDTGSYLPADDDLDTESLAQSASFSQPAQVEHPEHPTPPIPAEATPAPRQVGSSMELLETHQGHAADAPLCMTCGTKMRPAGSCYVCEGCGSTSGCS